MAYSFNKSLGRLTQQVSKSIGKRLEEKFAENNFAIKATDWTVISMLYQYGNHNQRDISNSMGLDKVMVKRIVDKLQQEGIVLRKDVKNDKRFNCIELTSKGKKTYEKLSVFAEEVICMASKNIPGKDLEYCIKILNKLKDNLLS